jgi:hypothetical protein
MKRITRKYIRKRKSYISKKNKILTKKGRKYNKKTKRKRRGGGPDTERSEEEKERQDAVSSALGNYFENEINTREKNIIFPHELEVGKRYRQIYCKKI